MKFIATLIILLLIIIIYAQDELEVLLTFEVPEDSVFFKPDFGAADFNGDGCSDQFFKYWNHDNLEEYKLQLYWGSPYPDAEPDEEWYIDSYYYSLVSWHGDLNGDSFNDLLYNRWYTVMDAGDILVFYGCDPFDFDPDEPDLVFYGVDYNPDTFELYFRGFNLDYDFNGDGYADILATAWGPQVIRTGQVEIFFGGEEIDTISDFHKMGGINEQLAYKRAVGDFNGDGFDDLIISRNIGEGEEIELQYELYYGAEILTPNIDHIFENIYGDSVTNIIADGDINGDGFDDLIILQRIDDDEEYFDIYLGNDINDFEIDYLISNTISNRRIIYSDINNDNFSDIIISAGGGYYMEVSVYYGGADFNTEPDIIIEAPEDSWFFAEYMYNMNDFNGDGLNEIMINEGSPYNKASLYYLSTNSYSNSIISETNPTIMNYPNPFKNSTTIHIIGNKTISNYTVVTYNILGEKLFSIDNEDLKSNNSFILDINNLHNIRLSSGIYFLSLENENRIINISKMILLK